MADVERKKTLQEIKPEIDKSLEYLKTCEKYDTIEAYRHLNVLCTHGSPNTHVCDDLDAVCEYIGGSGIGELYSKMSKSLLAYLDQLNKSSKPRGFLALQKMTQLFATVSDASADCGLAIANCGGIPLLFQGLETIKSMDNHDKDIEFVMVRIFVTLHNMIRLCPSNLVYYRESNAVAFLKGYLQLGGVWQLFSLLTVAYVATDLEKKELASTEIGASVLMGILVEAVGANNHTTQVGSDDRAIHFSAFEVLDAINHIAVNDDVKMAVGNYEGGIPSIIRMLQDDFSPEEQRVAAEALWNLAFIEPIRQSDILQDTLPRLKELAKSRDKELRGASASALFEIQGGIVTDAASPSRTTPSTPPPSYQEAISEPDQSKKPHLSVQVMISYQWDIKERAIEIRDMILAAGYKVWMDVTHLRGDILEAMAKAVETSDVILYCMTERYKDSKSCRLEAEYAENLSKKMIPLLLQKKYKPDGWLGILLGKDLYYNLYPELSEEDVQQSMGELLKAIAEQSPPGDQPDGPTPAGNAVATPNTTPSKQPAGKWSKQEVQKWLKDNDLTELCEKFKVFDGRHLKKMYTKCSKDEDKFEEDMKKTYKLDETACLNFVVNLQDAFSE